jgi:hypothetical protein
MDVAADDQERMTATRRALHAVAELVIAGPQHRRAGTIRMRVESGGFGGVALPVRVEGAELVWPGGRAALAGTCRALAVRAGLEVGPPDGLYHDHADLGPDDELVLDAAAAECLAGWWATGDAALRAFAPDVEPVLWPEHFDLGFAVDEITYGVSPGDAALPDPYAYVAPFERRVGPFWNAPFGAARPARDVADAEALRRFFAEGRDATAGPS